MKLITSIFILTLMGCYSSLIGTSVPPYPDGIVSKYGKCIGKSLGKGRLCDYAVGELRQEDEKPYALTVKKQIGRSGNRAIWEITDQIDWPEEPDNTFLSMGICLQNGVFDDTIVALVEVTEKRWFKAKSWAQKVDLKTGKFFDISPDGVECENEGWGL
ncbi:hypothetical protein [Marinobacterium arenosum]|uniref:hypothetical protein n=1 Tax=Marinobacterium arenosum TaxID=2862496 RepID=UPI001C96BE97|nr:hypothetical protein [Marinobacterium arenosum]MBY4677443.1 hypothetical protein [Marinobacterium arenosum]